jgi:hypothetical protein
MDTGQNGRRVWTHLELRARSPRTARGTGRSGTWTGNGAGSGIASAARVPRSDCRTRQRSRLGPWKRHRHPAGAGRYRRSVSATSLGCAAFHPSLVNAVHSSGRGNE